MGDLSGLRWEPPLASTGEEVNEPGKPMPSGQPSTCLARPDKKKKWPRSQVPQVQLRPCCSRDPAREMLEADSQDKRPVQGKRRRGWETTDVRERTQ